MKKILPVWLLLLSMAAAGQTDSRQGTENQPVADSAVQHQPDSAEPITTPAYEPDPGFRSNMDYLLEIQQKNREKQRKAAITRIAIGAAFLALLIVGLVRRRKK